MDITAFIRELLYGHDCVIIPGFGGFIGNYTPARIDRETGTFYPPVKQISFNRNLNHNDGLLIGRISVTTGIDWNDAKNNVDEFVSDLRKSLDKGEKISLEKIGSLTSNNEGNIQFEPDRSSNYHLDSYGFEPFSCFPLTGIDVARRTRQLNMEPVRQTYSRKILLRAAVVVPFLALLVAVPLKTNLFRNKVESTTLNPLITAEFENNKKAVDSSTLISIDNKKAEDSNQVITTPDKEPVSEPSVINKETVKPENTASTESVSTPVSAPAATIGSYFVITGSFKARENAQSQVEMLRQEGFTPEIVTLENGFFRVCAMACNDMSTANNKKDSIIARYPGAWVSRKK